MDIYLAQNALSLISLFAMALQDLKYKKISCIVLYAYLFTGAVNAYFTRHPVNIVISAMPGIVLLILGLVTNEKIGYGDGLVVLGLGFWLGLFPTLFILFVGTILSSVVSLIYMINLKRKGLSVKKMIPFVPFILIGMVVFICYGKTY